MKKKYNFDVIKASGNREPFSIEQYTKSLKRAGLTDSEVKETLSNLESRFYDGMSTQELYEITFDYLAPHDPVCASRYSMKDSLRRLGPTGFPFEQIVAEILKRQNYKIKTNQELKGKCVEHEVDVVAFKNDKCTLVEVKFHTRIGYRTSIKTILYVKARFDDLSYVRKNNIVSCLLATNTKFTSDVIDYAKCQNIQLLAWGYPKGKGIDSLINKYGLFPITSLVSLSYKEKNKLLDANIVLCKNIVDSPDSLESLSLSSKKRKQIIKECSVLCY